MPLLPGTNVSVIPILQLLVLTPLVFRWQTSSRLRTAASTERWKT